MDRCILHVDANCFYANVEMLHHPELEGKPVAVGGDPDARHGIVLTANYIAKRKGVKTGMALWQAKQACPDVVFLPPRMDLYLRFSKLLLKLYSEYTDKMQSYGCDEAWLQIDESFAIKGDAWHIAEEIRERVKREIGITVSIGISWNKIFAKLGSDYKKPDAITEISRENYKTIAWNLPAADLLYVGRKTAPKLERFGIKTIGDIAKTDPGILEKQLGKMGLILYMFANGEDDSPVSKEGYDAPVKSIGNSTTTPRDLVNNQDVQLIFQALSESVSARLRKHGFKANVIGISVRSNDLYHFSRQKKISQPTNITDEIMAAAQELFLNNYDWRLPIRSLGIRAADLVEENIPVQLDLFMNEQRRERQQKLDACIDEIRRRFGYFSIQRAMMLTDTALSGLDAMGNHTVHPIGYFNG